MDSFRKSSSTTLNHLPNEIIYKIFTYLDVKSIKQFSLVNKRLANLLASSTALLNKHFKLKIIDESFWNDRDRIIEVLYSRRHLAELDLANISGNHNVLIALFQKYGLQITTLKISSSKIDDFTFREILRLCPMLKNLYLSEVAIIKKLPAINPVYMANLDILSIQYCDWIVFKFFMQSQLQQLIIKNYLDEGNRKDLVNFLATQLKLNDMVLHGTAPRALFQNNDVNNNCSYSLKSFCIDNGIGKNSSAVNWNISTFLSLHDCTMKNLEISGPHNEHIAAFSLMNLENITSLVLDVRCLPKNQEFYQALAEEPKNLILQNVKLCGFFFQQDFVKSILLKFPLIKKLEINDWSNGSLSDLLHFISRNLVNIESLTITEISSSEDIKLKGLKNLTVHYIRNGKKLTKFIAKNESVEKLNIGFVYIGQIKNFVEDLRDFSNIKFLRVGGNKTALKQMLKLIVNDAPEKLEKLELSLVCEEKANTRKAIKFNLPFDRNDLNLKFNVLM